MAGEYGSGLGTLSGAASGARTVGGAPGELVSVSFEPSLQDMSQAFENWAKLIEDWRPVWSDVIHKFKSHESYHLRTEGTATGRKFVKLSPAYKAWKDRHYPGKPIMTLTGALRLALTKGGPGWFQHMRAEGLTAGVKPNSAVGVYAYAHAFAEHGFHIGKFRPPVRYDPKVAVKGLKPTVGGGQVPFGTAVAQLFQIYIVLARKRAFAAMGSESVFADNFEAGIASKRKGVLRLRTR